MKRPNSGTRLRRLRLLSIAAACALSLGDPNKGMSGFSLSLGYPTPAEAKKAFDALAAGGKVTMPLGKTFWAEAFGMLTDQFGVGWMVSGGGEG